MNSIKRVPTRVKSRRVEANLGAEREHFEKQQVNTEEEGWLVFLRENIWCFYTRCCLIATLCVCGCVCVRASECGGTGQGAAQTFYN